MTTLPPSLAATTSARLSTLVENSMDIMLVASADGDLLYVSPSVRRLLGYDPADVLASSAMALVHPDDRVRVLEVLATAVQRPGPTEPLSCRVRHADGRWRWIEGVGNNMLDDAEVRGIVVNARDVTDRVEVEQALFSTNRVLRTVRASAGVLVHGVDELDLCQAMCQVIVSTGGYARAWIGVPDPSCRLPLVPIADCGGDAAFMEQAMALVEEQHWGPAAAAFLTGSARVTPDVAKIRTGPLQQLVVKFGYRSLLSIPLVVEGEVVGVLSIYASEPNAFRAREIALLEDLGLDLAYGMTALRARSQRDTYAQRLQLSLGQLVSAVGMAAECRDPYTAGHQSRVSSLASGIGSLMGMPEHDLAGLRMAADIHDIGKLAVPIEILAKPTRLTSLEFELVKGHVEAGYAIVKDVEFPWPVPEMIRQHHERLDGSGYPRGLGGDEILPGARIIAVADTVEAMSNHRPYRPGLGVAAALDEVTAKRATLFDPDVVDACVEVCSGPAGDALLSR